MAKKDRSEKLRDASTEPHWLAEAFASAHSIELKIPGITIDGGQLVLEVHNEIFRLPEDWVRLRDWVDGWRRAAERDPRYRTKEDDTIDHYLRAAMEFFLGVKDWKLHEFERDTTPQAYECALVGYYRELAAAAPEPEAAAPRKVGRPPKF